MRNTTLAGLASVAVLGALAGLVLGSSSPPNTPAPPPTASVDATIGARDGVLLTARDLLDRCLGNGESVDECLIESLHELAGARSWMEALSTMPELTALDQNINCHQIVHSLGYLAATELELSEMVESDPGTCGDGFSHGWVSARASQGSLEDLVRVNSELCASEDARKDFVRSNKGVYYSGSCAHGLGHAVYQIYPYDFRGGMDRCAQLRVLGGWEAGKCVSGLLMAFSMKEPILSGGDPIDLGRREVALACGASDGEVARECWYMGQEFFSDDPEGLSEVCETYKNSEDCPVGLGYLAYRKSTYLFLDAAKLCLTVSKNSVLAGCLYGALHAEWIYALASGEDPDIWRPDCAALPPAAVAYCTKDFSEILTRYRQTGDAHQGRLRGDEVTRRF